MEIHSSKRLLYTVLLIAFFASFNGHAFSQQKYFSINYYKATGKGWMEGPTAKLEITTKEVYIPLAFKGKTPKQFYDALRSYLKNRPGFKIGFDKGVESGFFAYRDFSIIGNKDKCFADLVALAYINIVFDHPDTLLVRLGVTSKVYASIFDAKLQITPDDDVASIDDAPFNEYQFMQPDDERVLTSNAWTGTHTKKRALKQAYPDSVFDPDGKVVNMYNKNLIENHFDQYIIDLEKYLRENLK